MKSFLIAIIFALTLGTLSLAQTFPLNRFVAWDPLLDASVTNYVLVYDNVLQVFPLSICTGSICKAPITITTPGPHTVSVYGQNTFGDGAATTLTFTASAPGKVTGVRLTIN